jgi:hypothetical protein
MMTIHIPIPLITFALGYIAGIVSVLFLGWLVIRSGKKGESGDE